MKQKRLSIIGCGFFILLCGTLAVAIESVGSAQSEVVVGLLSKVEKKEAAILFHML